MTVRASLSPAQAPSARAGDEFALASLFEHHRRELRQHCHRMMGSFEDSEDLVQETFLRAWRWRASARGSSSRRAWLYRIATNACLDALARKPRRVLRPRQAAPEPAADQLLEGVAPSEDEPDAVIVARETIELAFLAAIQHLPPRQRAVVVLRDVLDWSAKDTASLMETSPASVNSALQRARASLKEHLPAQRQEWGPSSEPSAEQRAVVRRFMEATERSDPMSSVQIRGLNGSRDQMTTRGTAKR